MGSFVFRVATAVVLLAALAACRRTPPAGPAPEATRPPVEAASRQVAEDEVLAPRQQTLPEDVAHVRLAERALCRDSGCCVESLQRAGTDRRGRTLVVATLAMDGADCLLTRERPPSAFGSGKLDRERSPLRQGAGASGEPPAPAADAGAEASAEPGEKEPDEVAQEAKCRAFEHHLVIIHNGKVRGRQLLTRHCNDGYGMGGDDKIEVDGEARTFTHTREGFSGSYEWNRDVTIGLDPVRLLSESRYVMSKREDEGGDESVSVSWEPLNRHQDWQRPDCGEETKDEADGEGEESGGAGYESKGALAIPSVTLPAAFTGRGWRTIGLRHCAVLVDSKENGFTLHGEPGDAADATLRAVASPGGVLFVEVSDDRWTGPSRNWIKDDHLELWVSTGEDVAPCAPLAAGQRPGAVQWGIRIADGATFAASGKPQPLHGVEVVRRGSVARVKIPLPRAEEPASIGVVYSDSDDGKKQKRLIATADLVRGRPDTLSGYWTIDPQVATCAVKDGALVLTPAQPHDPGTPVGDLDSDLQ
jgi:hypothetical protein